MHQEDHCADATLVALFAEIAVAATGAGATGTAQGVPADHGCGAERRAGRPLSQPVARMTSEALMIAVTSEPS
jgi:hypothetical protein